MSRLSISLLGGFEVALDGQRLTAFGTDKVRALLAYLAMEAGRPRRRTVVAELLWPELPEERASHSLRQALLLLRRALGEADTSLNPSQPFLLLGRQDIQLNPMSNYHLDVTEFLKFLRASREHQHASAADCSTCIGWLQQAAALYRGDLLAGFALRDSPSFEEWQVTQQEALHGQAVDLLARMAEHFERRGEPARVLEYAQRLVALEPWQERAQMQVMVAFAQLGQEPAALEQYTSYSRMLSQEFGMLPPVEATALYEQIRARQAGGQNTPLVASGALPVRGSAGTAAGPRDERRQVTALVCRRQVQPGLDPEELHEQMTRCSEQCAPFLERFGAQRQPRRGADCLAYFGYPVAQEDAARRAVSAGLAMIAAARGSDPLRIGIHTGMMVAGDGGLLGTVPDLASDCMRLARPGSVMITADTERLVHGWYDCQPAGDQGSAELALLYEVKDERAEPTPLDWQVRAQMLTPLAGRDEELLRFTAGIEAARKGHGQVITLCGEPGIGKTRLVWEVKQRCAGQVRWLEGRCSPYFQNSSLYPVIRMLEQLFGFEPADDSFARCEKLSASLGSLGLGQASVWLLSLLLGLPTDSPPPTAITQDQRQWMREVILSLVEREAARQPLVLVIEDLHWADPTTVAWVSRSVEELVGIRCAVVLTWRPGFAAPWLPQANALALELGPLSAAQTAGMVAGIAGQAELSAAAREQIVRQTDGVPLYVEELTRAALDPGLRQAYPVDGVSHLPSTLRDSLTARLDRTGAAKETAQWAAALGRGVSHVLLAAVVPYDERRLHADLSVLLAAGLIQPEVVAGRPGYAFRHALIHDAAYGMLLKRTRQEYHRRVAETMASSFPEIAEGQPEILAYQYSQAGLPAKAADQWIRAGERAAAQGATAEARTFFDRALAEIEAGDVDRRWRALAGREAVLSLRNERAAQRADIQALLELAEAGDDRRRAQAFLRQRYYASAVADYALGLRSAESAREAAARTGDPALEVEVLSTTVQALCEVHDFSAAGAVVEKTLAKLPAVQDEVVEGYALGALAMYYGHLGDGARSLQLQLRGLDVARRVGDRLRVSKRLANIGLHYCQMGLYTEALAAHKEGLALAEAIGDRHVQTMQRWNLCHDLACLGELDRARAVGEQALQELREAGQNSLALATCLGHLGVMLEAAGDPVTAAGYLAEACAVYAEADEAGPLMELQAVEARALLALRRRDEAARLAAEVWAYVRGVGVVMIDFPSRTYVCVADVVDEVETPGITAREVLEAGYDLIMRSAERIENPDWRQSFLHERSNQALLERWQAVCEHGTVRLPR